MLLNDIIINNYDFRRSKNLIWETWKINELYIRFKLINDVIYKLCTKCKKYKPMTSKFFPRRNNVKCGYGSHCKECEKEKESKRIRIPSFNENGKCALSNLEMQTVIKPGRAYSLSNIRLVCNSINTMRSNLSDEEFLSFCKAVVDYLSI